MTDTLGRILGHARKYSFRKAERKYDLSQSSVVTIHNLKSSRDDGILFPDDQLNDVADDREQIIAVFDESYSPLPPYCNNNTCGDVTSTSSVCTGSPDLFSVEVGSHCSIPYTNNNNAEVSEDHQPLGVMPLQVRRGSEPALNCLFPTPSSTDPNKRWSTAVVINTDEQNNHHQNSEVHENGINHPASPVESLEMNGDSKMSSLTTFSRGSGRLSILGNSAETYRWVEAADRQLMKDFNENFHIKAPVDAGSDTSSLSDERESREKTVILKNETGPLGIHVVPDYDNKGRDTGLVIQGIEPGGRIDRDGRLQVGDHITEINGRCLRDVGFRAAQDIFKSALATPQIRLQLVREPSAAAPRKPPPPVYPKPPATTAPPPPAAPTVEEDAAALVEGEERAGGISTKVATVTPTKKVPSSAVRRLASANTRKIGKMLTIDLTKGHTGLGFSITTRDNPAGGNSPIYIKNVLPKGAAIEDGRLQPGDRLLEVNGIPMTGKTQSEAVTVLRNVPLGKTVQLVVSRQETEEAEPVEPESETLPGKIEEEAGIFPWKYREILTFQIPLTDSHSAGLGVSVKGKSTSTANGSVDLGIFIKAVIPGGAASKDGRLQTNDQLVNINGISLLGMSNSNAMETLRNAMTQTDGPIRNAIILTVARRIPSPTPESATSPVQPPENLLLDDIQMKNTPGLPGCNPVVERLTGQQGVVEPYVREEQPQRPLPYCGVSALRGAVAADSVLIEGEYDTEAGPRKTEDHGNRREDVGVVPAGSQSSLNENQPGFARDGFGRQSMSEKRHAQLDARNTGTYQRTKKAREEREKQGDSSPESKTDNGSSNLKEEAVGPSLGLRKSSSLESLQTMIQELSKDDEAKKRALQAARGSRSRGCNESFRAAVDRSYDAPASANTMETLDEESENGSAVGHILTRSTELVEAHPSLDPFHEDLLNMYCRNSKSSKKKSLLKGLGSVFKFGKNRKQSQDLKGKDDDFAQDNDSLQQGSLKDQDKLSDISKDSDATSRRQQSATSLDSAVVPNRQERMQSLREQYQRMHQKRQGQYPLEQKEEYYENELKEKEGNYALPFEVIHSRSQSLDIHKDSVQSKPHTFSGDPNRYSHYMNYREIQQHIGHRVQVHPIKSEPKPLPPEAPPPRDFFPPPPPHHMQKLPPPPPPDTNSLPRGTGHQNQSDLHQRQKPYYVHETHEHGNYGRMNMNHFYSSNNKLYSSHIVPGSKV